ncbi:DAO domain-containing protein [Mycena chlorophos]|uniref:DAO domain-containing protein n=1 Tax=Mycena chlorophos TaxID=658473 RepID=A0A8H6T1F3_MYCCL|nr:DAO domain-containing protein [Mycena chlorophos]
MSCAASLLLLLRLVSAASVPPDQSPFSISTNQHHRHHHQPAALPHPNPTHSFWTHTPGANPLASEGSTGPLTDAADVCIVGSGITGVSASYHLAKAVKVGTLPVPAGKSRLRAVVLEARDFCSGATGRNGGNLTPYEFQHFSALQQRFGREDALRHYAIEHYSATEIVRIAREAGWADDVDVVEGGHMDLITAEEELAGLQQDAAAAEAAGKRVNVTWFTREAMNAVCFSSLANYEQRPIALQTYGTYNLGVRSPGYNLWPLKFVNKLFLEANSTTPALDLRLHTHTPVTSVVADDSSSTWSLRTPRGAINCSFVVHATNGYASHLLPQFAGHIAPVRGQVIATRAAVPLSELTTSSWAGDEGYWFPRPVPTNDSQHPLVILGGRRVDAGHPYEVDTTDDSAVNPTIGRSLRAFLPRLFPRFFDAATSPEMEWTGIMGYTASCRPFPHFLLQVGRVPAPAPAATTRTGFLNGQYIAAGYTGHGMPRAYACAEAVVGMIAAEVTKRQWTPPEWLPHSFLTQATGWARSEHLFS